MPNSWYPHITAATIVEVDNKFLMVEEASNIGNIYNQPAGHLEKDESLIDAAIRETLEETGWLVEVESLCGFYLYTSSNNNTTYLRCCFIAKAIKHTEGILDNGIIAAHWMSYQDIINMKPMLRSPMVIKCLDDYLNGQRLPLSSIHYHTHISN